MTGTAGSRTQPLDQTQRIDWNQRQSGSANSAASSQGESADRNKHSEGARKRNKSDSLSMSAHRNTEHLPNSGPATIREASRTDSATRVVETMPGSRRNNNLSEIGEPDQAISSTKKRRTYVGWMEGSRTITKAIYAIEKEIASIPSTVNRLQTLFPDSSPVLKNQTLASDSDRAELDRISTEYGELRASISSGGIKADVKLCEGLSIFRNALAIHKGADQGDRTERAKAKTEVKQILNRGNQCFIQGREILKDLEAKLKSCSDKVTMLDQKIGEAEATKQKQIELGVAKMTLSLEKPEALQLAEKVYTEICSTSTTSQAFEARNFKRTVINKFDEASRHSMRAEAFYDMGDVAAGDDAKSSMDACIVEGEQSLTALKEMASNRDYQFAFREPAATWRSQDVVTGHWNHEGERTLEEVQELAKVALQAFRTGPVPSHEPLAELYRNLNEAAVGGHAIKVVKGIHQFERTNEKVPYAQGCRSHVGRPHITVAVDRGDRLYYINLGADFFSSSTKYLYVPTEITAQVEDVNGRKLTFVTPLTDTTGYHEVPAKFYQDTHFNSTDSDRTGWFANVFRSTDGTEF